MPADAFAVPPRPAPRERYTARVTPLPGEAGTWIHVDVLDVLDGGTVVAGYDRDAALLGTFEPFRQGDRDYALVSPQYTATSVLDLRTGEIVAGEEPSTRGFCPVGFFVPDWWDVHDGDVLPGSPSWRAADHEWPSAGDLGFVWGSVFGGDPAVTVQLLDLSGVRDGVLRREDRFGPLRLAADPKLAPADFIRCSSRAGVRRVRFYAREERDLP